ncbi:MAG: cysteine--tRNA ligase [Campylobacterota bacterium]
MVLYDAGTKEKRQFQPTRGRDVTIYVCGPTVYDDAHLGHARSAVTFDLLRRVLEAGHYSVTYASNITDVDDKIINKAIEQQCTIKEVAQKYTRRYFDQIGALNVRKPDHVPTATQSLEAIWHMIEALLDKGFAYRTKSGDIYFDTAKDSAYGSLSKMLEDASQVRHRVQSSDEKKDPRDFALFKASDDEHSFDSPFGKGRPGWHIECSAMIDKLFDSYVDIHGGGADLLFPHHENEAAQSRCYSGKQLAGYWVHNGFVRIGGEKMSKSLGNSFYLKDALARYHGEVIRFYLMGSHYRQDFNYSTHDLEAAKKRLDKLYRLKKRLHGGGAAKKAEKTFENAVMEALEDDLNTSVALAVIDQFVARTNEKLDSDSLDKGAKKAALANLGLIERVLGVGAADAFAYFRFGLDEAFVAEVEQMIEKRSQAKKEKDFAGADAIRDALSAKGIALMDTPDGTVWEKTS